MYRHLFLFLIVLSVFHLFSSPLHAQQGIKLMADDAFREEQFGRGGSILGDHALIGAPSHFNAEYGGKVYAFSRQNEGWMLTDSLFVPDITQGHSFGISIDMDSSFAVVGMMGDFANGLSSGSAFIYELVDGSWLIRDKLIPESVEAEDFFGRSVSISGGHVIVGSPGDDDQGNNAGAAYLFQLQEDGGWTEINKLLPSNGAEADSFGVSVAIDGDNALVGAPLADRMQMSSGLVTAFQLQEGAWEELPVPLQLDTETADDQFGTAIDIDSTFAVIAAPGFRGQGASYIFELVENSWVIKDTLITSDGRRGGHYASISTEYAVILTGSLNFTEGPAIFERSGEDWVHIPDHIQESDFWFGGEITLNGNEVLVGAYFDPEFGSDTGAAYLYDLTKTPPVITTSPDTLTLLDELYAYDVASTAFPAPIYSLVSAPESMTIDSLTGLIEWTPAELDTTIIEITASNTIAPADTQRFELVVTGIPPLITTTPDTLARINTPFTYQVQAAGNPPPTYSLAANPDSMTIGPETGDIAWTPDSVGVYEVIILASNRVAPTDSQRFEITVFDPSPTITSLPDTVAFVSQLYTYTAEATGDPAPVFSLLQSPDGMDIDSSSGLVSWTPSVAGDFDIELLASNGFAPADTQRFAITVIDNTDAEEEGALPERFEVGSIYPNPFSRSITIDYSVPKPSTIRVAVFDILGRQVTLVQDVSRPAGQHRVVWTPDDGITAGIYLIRITTDQGESVVREVIKQ